MEQRIDILNGQGFVELVDVMGDDQAIVDAVMSFWKNDSVPNGTLIDFMYRQYHFAPFEMCELKFLVKVYPKTLIKLLRHRTASINMQSTRYGDLTNDFFMYPPADDGPDQEPNIGIMESVWKINLRNFFQMMHLRLHPDVNDKFLTTTIAQDDIYECSNAMYTLVKQRFPLASAAFEKHTLNAVHFNSVEAEVLSQFLTWNSKMADQARSLGLNEREIVDFKKKLTRD